MSTQLRQALLDLAWASTLDALQAAYRRLETKPLTAHEREVVASLFNVLVSNWAIVHDLPEQTELPL